MRKKCNELIRKTAGKYHLFLWEVAELMGISYSGFLNRMRYEWSTEEQERVIRLIEEYAKGEGNE